MNALVLALMLAVALPASAAPSQCYGHVHKGRISDAVKLPLSGSNFSAYSSVAAAAGRTWVHADVAAILLDAYRAIPGTVFVYGETGDADVAPIAP